ncbi:MAG: hypothetical protein AVDCRST_MAG04-3427, partial [uncultured Acetobacteraceae bacterium]
GWQVARHCGRGGEAGVGGSRPVARSDRGGSGASPPADPGGLDQPRHRRGVWGAGGHGAPVAQHLHGGRRRGTANPHPAGSDANQSRAGARGGRGASDSAGGGPAELDPAAPGGRDRAARRTAHLPLAALGRAAAKGAFRWRRPRHTLEGRQDADAVDRAGLRRKLL